MQAPRGSAMPRLPPASARPAAATAAPATTAMPTLPRPAAGTDGRAKQFRQDSRRRIRGSRNGSTGRAAVNAWAPHGRVRAFAAPAPAAELAKRAQAPHRTPAFVISKRDGRIPPRAGSDRLGSAAPGDRPERAKKCKMRGDARVPAVSGPARQAERAPPSWQQRRCERRVKNVPSPAVRL